MSVATIVPCLNQIEFHPYLQQTEIVDFCHKNNILVAGYSVLTTLFRKPGGPIDSLVMALSKKYSKTPNQILYQWLLQHNAVIITTSGNKDRLKEALEIFSESKFKLDEVDFYKINSVGKELEYRRFWSQEDWS
ncbi:hypothetical protein HK099_008289 [Clydaea vesicula]|uniref:NADP-dependent oxidoreductase domain-containing protein n=1 Tax=Clydaea vesicula TaxID=447962 RepID=A0AAD5UB15_9FUNG|nr:hypothetical protein HK099_008289 [Clydaea vesicula]KAJ3397169.1 hypothetical protein HDU92_000474 [Lobulomyces angularis]